MKTIKFLLLAALMFTYTNSMYGQDKMCIRDRQIEGLTVSGTIFADNNLLMVGKKEITINSEYVVAEVPMERLAARVDIYMLSLIHI